MRLAPGQVYFSQGKKERNKNYVSFVPSLSSWYISRHFSSIVAGFISAMGDPHKSKANRRERNGERGELGLVYLQIKLLPSAHNSCNLWHMESVLEDSVVYSSQLTLRARKIKCVLSKNNIRSSAHHALPQQFRVQPIYDRQDSCST